MQAAGTALIGKIEQPDAVAGPCEVPDERTPRGHRLLHAVDADEEVGTFTEEHVGDFEAIDREHRFLHDTSWVSRGVLVAFANCGTVRLPVRAIATHFGSGCDSEAQDVAVARRLTPVEEFRAGSTRGARPGRRCFPSGTRSWRSRSRSCGSDSPCSTCCG